MAEKSKEQQLKEELANLPKFQSIVEKRKERLAQAKGELQSAEIDLRRCQSAIEILKQQVK